MMPEVDKNVVFEENYNRKYPVDPSTESMSRKGNNRVERIETRFSNQAKSRTFKNIIKRFCLDKKSVLDIGCSYGEHLIHYGPGSMGVSISRAEVEYGKHKGLNILYGNIETMDLDIPPNNFDVIFTNNMLDHLYSPHNFLCKIRKLLKPEGLLILGIPCFPKATCLLHLKKFRGALSGGHVNFFTKDTLTMTVERGGWNIIEVRCFHFYNKFIDNILDLIYPHFYVVAGINRDFKYPPKKVAELMGYIEVDKNAF